MLINEWVHIRLRDANATTNMILTLFLGMVAIMGLLPTPFATQLLLFVKHPMYEALKLALDFCYGSGIQKAFVLLPLKRIFM